MAADKVHTAEIKMKNGVLCNGNVFQNALRSVRRKALGSDQCSDLRNTVAASQLWSSIIHLTGENVFLEAFFTNAAIASKCLDVDFVYLDDTSCTNVFSLPLMASCAETQRQESTHSHGESFKIGQQQKLSADFSTS